MIKPGSTNLRDREFIMGCLFGKEPFFIKRERFLLYGYLKKDKDFSGLVLFYDLAGQFINVWRYTGGKVTHTINFYEGGNIPVRLKSGYLSCTINSITTWYKVETEWYSIGEYGSGLFTEPEYNGSSYGYYTETYYYRQCVWVEDGTGGGAYNGGSGSGSIENQPTLNASIKKLFVKGTTITYGPYIESVNNAYNDLNNDCFSNYVTNYLLSHNITLGSIKIDETYLGLAGISSTNDLTFGGSEFITVENLEHEWIHLAQRYINNTNIFNASNTGMAEFEIALISDILECINIHGNFDIYSEHPFACYGNGKYNHQKEYQDWLKSITSGGTIFPSSIVTGNFLYWANIFGDVSISYNKSRGYQYTNSYYKPKTISTISGICYLL